MNFVYAALKSHNGDFISSSDSLYCRIMVYFGARLIEDNRSEKPKKLTGIAGSAGIIFYLYPGSSIPGKLCEFLELKKI